MIELLLETRGRKIQARSKRIVSPRGKLETLDHVGLHISVYPVGQSWGKQRVLFAKRQALMQKVTEKSRTLFLLSYFSPRQTVRKLSIQGGMTDK